MTNREHAPTGYTLVTVAHRDDYGLMRLQARSLDKYLDRDLTTEIIVIENPQPNKPTNWRRELIGEFGALAPKVRFIESHEVASIPAKVDGWFSQQILKLMASSVVSTDRYIILDGKNHLVHPLTRSIVEAPSGRLRSYLMNYEAHSMRPFLENTLSYFGLCSQDHMRAFLPTTTPFALPTGLVRELVREVEARERRPFPGAFLCDGYKRSEFFLFAAYILSLGKSLSDIYEFSAAKSPAIWPHSTAGDCLDAIAASEMYKLPIFALHRRAFPNLNYDTRCKIAAFWYRRGLFESIKTPLSFLLNYDALADGTDLSDGPAGRISAAGQ